MLAILHMLVSPALFVGDFSEMITFDGERPIRLARKLLKFVQSPRAQPLTVVGTFRSGTNLTKLILEDHFYTNVSFSKWWWKHGLPPTSAIGKSHFRPDEPIIVVSKHPAPFNVSLYHFWGERRPELDRGRTVSEFIRKDVIIYDNSYGLDSPRYIFSSPTEYWNQFYYAFLNWNSIADSVFFVRHEKLVADPDRVFSAIARKFKLNRRTTGKIELPKTRVLPSADRKIAVLGQGFVERPSELSDEDRDYVCEVARTDVLAGLGYDSYA